MNVNTKDFSEMKNDELGSFLKNRGIPVHDRKKNDRIQLAKAADNLGFPLRPKPDEIQAVIKKDKDNLLMLENGIIKLPNPEELVCWQSKLIKLPTTSGQEVIVYVDKRLKLFNMNIDAERTKALKDGESLLLSGHVRKVEMHQISPNLKYCFVRAIVNPAMSRTQDPYKVWVALHKETSDIEAAHCVCPAGLRGFCKHVMALLHLIVREVEQGCNIACTSKPQQWHKPKAKGKIHNPDFIKNVIVHQAKGQFHTSPDDFGNSPRTNFDPRPYEYRREKSLTDFDLDRLKRITDGNCAVFLYTPLNDAISESVNVSKNCSQGTAEQPDQNVKIQSIPDITADILNRSPGISLQDFEEALMQKIEVDKETITNVVKQTKSQSASSTWFSLRKGRITASKVLECTKKVHNDDSVSQKNNSLLGHMLGYTHTHQTNAMKHGIKMERTCINHYSALQKKRHIDFQVISTGLHICQQYPFIAASPDGIINCSCPAESPTCSAQGRKGCLEVKNPFTSDNITVWAKKPSSCLFVDKHGTLKLKRDHLYYSQVQCQMFVTNTDYADFVVRTSAKSANIHIERINIDEEFIDNMITKCVTVFNKVIVPELYHGIVKAHYMVRFVKEIIEKIVQVAVCISESQIKVNGKKRKLI